MNGDVLHKNKFWSNQMFVVLEDGYGQTVKVKTIVWKED